MLRPFAIITFLMIYTIAGFSGPLENCCLEKVSVQIKKSKTSSCHKVVNSKQDKKEHKRPECPLKFCCLTYFSDISNPNMIKNPSCIHAQSPFQRYQDLAPQLYIGKILRPPISSKA